ncbi:MAG: hypothetical protein ACK5XN_00820 [Bacteroidota bacterium]
MKRFFDDDRAQQPRVSGLKLLKSPTVLARSDVLLNIPSHLGPPKPILDSRQGLLSTNVGGHRMVMAVRQDLCPELPRHNQLRIVLGFGKLPRVFSLCERGVHSVEETILKEESVYLTSNFGTFTIFD